MEFKIITDIKKCRQLWELFSPNKDWGDLWEVRQCFIGATGYQLHCLIGYKDDEVMGVLPLWFNQERACYTTISDDFLENNKLFIRDKSKISLFLQECPENTVLYYIDKAEKNFYDFAESLSCKYYLNLEKIDNIDQYLSTFSKKHRKNFNYDIRRIMASGLKVEVNKFNNKIIDSIEKYNIERFQQESSFKESGFKQSMANLIKLAGEKKVLQLITITKEDEIVAAEFAVFYNNVYLVLMGGSDPKINNLGKLLIYKHIENAINLRAKKLDFMAGAENWKRLGNFSIEKMYYWDNFKIRCLECAKENNTCCEGNCTRFVTLHDLLRLEKLGYKFDEIASFETMQDWEIEHRKDKLHCSYYDLGVNNKLLMLKKGKNRCLFLDSENLCKIHSAVIVFCKIFPFWLEDKTGKIIFDPAVDQCKICPDDVEAINERILNNQLTLDDRFFKQIGLTEDVWRRYFAVFQKEIEEYKKYSQDLADGFTPAQIVKKYNIHL